MPSYQTMLPDEKSSLLRAELVQHHPELASAPLIIEHHHNGSRCACEPIRNYRNRRPSCCGKLCRLLFWVVAGAFAMVFLLRHNHQRGHFMNLWGSDDSGDTPMSVSQCRSATIPYSDKDLKYTFDVAADGNPKGFHFAQRWVSKSKTGSPFNRVRTAGEVIVQAAAPGSAPVTVDLDVKLSHAELSDSIRIKQEPGSLVFESERKWNGLVGDACISVIATIFVAPSTNVSHFDINTVVLPVLLKDTLRLTAENIFVHSVSGAIASETTSLTPRKIEIETTSSSISGFFPLADLLSVGSVSGHVDLIVQPLKSDHTGVFAVRTSSGGIKIDTASTSIPNRNFTSQVHTLSGSVSGSFLLGVSSKINTASGSITADFHTAGEALKRSLDVNSVSGRISARVYDEFEFENTFSHFQSQSGAVGVQFPASWQGSIQGKTKTGSVEFVGDGVKIIKDARPVPGLGRIVQAIKGDGESRIEAETLSGSIGVRFE